MSTKEERQERFLRSITSEDRKFPWPWHKTAEYVLSLRKGAQLEGAVAGQGIGEPQETGEAENEDIVRGLLQVHQQQQQTVAAAEEESRSLRGQLDKSRQQLQNIFMQAQQQQSQMQQMQMQAQQAIQEAAARAEQVQQGAAPEIQKAQQSAAMAQQQATQSRIDLAKLQQVYEQTRRSVLDYKNGIMQAVAQDPVTLAEAQKMQQDQQMAQAQAMQAMQAQAMQAQSANQGGAAQAPEQAGMVVQASRKRSDSVTPVKEIARAIAGQGDRAGYRKALAEKYLNLAANEGAASGQGGAKIPADSLAGEVLKQGELKEKAVKIATQLNETANDLRVLQGGSSKGLDDAVLRALLSRVKSS